MVRNSIRPKALFTATAIALIMSGGAWAQGANETDKAAPATQSAPMPAATAETPAATEQATGEGFITAQEEGQALASDLVGAKIVTTNGEDLGKVDDLILDSNGKLQGAVLSVGGFLGIGDKRVAVPWPTIKPGAPDQPLVVAMSKAQLEAAPEFMTLADQQAQRQAAAAPPSAAVPAPVSGAGSQ